MWIWHGIPGRRPVIRPFYLDRREDISGVSGTGVVAVGVMLPSGKCVLEWRSHLRTVTVFESAEQVTQIHGHDGRTVLRWGTPPPQAAAARGGMIRRRLRGLSCLWRRIVGRPRAGAL